MIPHEPCPPRSARRQRGNALILALLALLVMGLAAVAAMQSKQIEAKRASGQAEASVLEGLRNAAQAAVYEHLAAIQQGQPMEKGGVMITPTTEAGELTWSPTVGQLRDMGYLPAGWTATRSSLNDGPYAITFQRIPAGCAPAACDVQGTVVIGAPILDAGRGSPVDGVVIGPILTRAGADGGVSLPTTPTTISGFHATWSTPNLLPGTPAGVVAMRFGTQTGGFSQFVRVGDSRDPALRGNLTADGNFQVGGESLFSGPGNFVGNVDVQGEIRVGPASSPCLTGSPGGILSVSCAGELRAQNVLLSDSSGNQSLVGPSGLTSTGRVDVADGIRVGQNRLFDSADPQSIYLQQGQLLVRGASGLLADFRDGNLSIPNSVSTRFIDLSNAAEEGFPCEDASTPEVARRFGSTVNGALAVCVRGRWVVPLKMGQAGQGCPIEGSLSVETSDGSSLICRSGIYLRTNALLSNFVLIQTVAIQISGSPVRVQKPTCPHSGASDAVPLIILTPNSEDTPAVGFSLSGINRFAFDQGDEWEVRLERSSDFVALPGRIIASIYCYYG